MAKPKRLSRQARLGQLGVNLLEGIILEMGSRWTPSGPNEVGIDGYIELFEPKSGKPLGTSLAVQSKAVSRLQHETETGFIYQCERRDVEYWLKGNMPIVLVISRPVEGDAYWISLKDYFTGARASSGSVRFNKASDRLTPDSFEALSRLGRAVDEGLYLAPVPREETLHSNLLSIKKYPPTVWVGQTDLRYPGQVWAKLNEKTSRAPGSWLLRSKSIVSFTNLRELHWEEICDPGTVEAFESSEWAEATDQDKMNEFVELLNRTLSTQLYPDVRYWAREECFAMTGTLTAGTKRRSYGSLKRRSRMAVVTKYDRTLDDGRHFEWLRHLAFRGQFRRLEADWYIEITPTYRFTSDGLCLERFHESRLKRIKEIERNRAVLAGVLYWADYLTSFAVLFETPELQFGELLTFESTVGLVDEIWAASDEPGVEGGDPLENQLSLLGRSERRSE